MVNTAVLGNDDNLMEKLEIAEKANLRIRAIDKINCLSNFIISNEGFANFESDNSISMTGSTISAGGSATLTSKQVCLSSNFTVEKGAVLKINN